MYVYYIAMKIYVFVNVSKIFHMTFHMNYYVKVMHIN